MHLFPELEVVAWAREIDPVETGAVIGAQRTQGGHCGPHRRAKTRLLGEAAPSMWLCPRGKTYEDAPGDRFRRRGRLQGPRTPRSTRGGSTQCCVFVIGVIDSEQVTGFFVET